MALRVVKGQEPQAGSFLKRWDRDELVRCGATGTTAKRFLNLEGEIHPVFKNWTTASADADLHAELQQPLLLASRLLETTAALEWISDFLVDDIFDEQYPGREKCPCFRPQCQQTAPQNIVRHHRASWATPELEKIWLDQASVFLRDKLPKSIEWQLDSGMFKEKGWVGYTCRSSRGDLTLGQLDKYEMIEKWDQSCKDLGYRKLTMLLMAEYPRGMRGLSHGSEEQLLTAFMATVTILHEIAHAVFWCDFRSLTKSMCEPFYGADLEMELGDSFIAHIFGGWIPVPVKDPVEFREAPTFGSGLAWRQNLSWDYHRLRPKHRAHYSIPVDYIAKLFEESTWKEGHDLKNLIQPRSLVPYREQVGLDFGISKTGQHAAAALADFHRNGEDLAWNKRSGAQFRIPQYDGYLWLDWNLPVAPDDVIKEPQARELSERPAVKPVETSTTRYGRNPSDLYATAALSPKLNLRNGSKKRQSQRVSLARLSKVDFQQQSLSNALEGHGLDRCEITVDELKKRLSRLIGVSLNELELLFDPR